MGNLDSMLDELNNMENSITLRDENGEEVKLSRPVSFLLWTQVWLCKLVPPASEHWGMHLPV